MSRLPQRALIASAVATVLLVLVVALVPAGAAPALDRAMTALPRAKPLPLCAACGLFVVSLLCSAGAWRTTVSACGGWIEGDDAAAFYGLGSLANTLLPARAGDGVRVALFSRTLPHEGRMWTMSGIMLALSVARSGALLVLVLAAVVLGALPVWPLAMLGALLLLAIVLAVRVRRTRPQSRVAHLLDAFRALGESPRTSAALAGWAGASIAARVAAAAAAAAVFGARSPVLAAFVIVPALDLGTLLPLTPASLGMADGAVAVALHTAGTPVTAALTIGIGLHAAETVAGVGFGSWSLLYLGGTRAEWMRRLSAVLVAVAGLGGAAIVGALIWT
ncbi:MAG: flippase-like domain-containing protein [Solirubrobacterales bacterium]|nr:flippase-like domain-containing protein [Solirubrobacterales bacterium]